MPSGEHNLAWLASNLPCRTACPVGTHAGGYVSLLGAGRTEEAFALARRPNPLASVCGLICAHPCESACRRGALDKPLSIRALKRYATERFGAESGRDFDEIAAVVDRPRPPAESPGKVAVVGAGPAGLACAHDLRLMGHEVVVMDAAPVAGGMLRMGIPDYRLPPAILQREVDFIEHLGVEFRYQFEVGRDISFADLREEYDAVFLATGCRKGKGLPIEGADHPEVITAVEFLAAVNLGHEITLGNDVLVIGGGNVAFDAARSARRMDKGEGGDQPVAADDSEGELDLAAHMNLALDAAKIAAFSMKKKVKMTCLESRAELPADDIELEEAMEEGIEVLFRRSPNRIMIGEDGVEGLEVRDVSRVFDEDGRFSPQVVDGSEKIWKCDTVIIAIGQVADLSFLGDDSGLDATPRSTVVVDPETLATNLEGVFAGGDLAKGPRIAIEAVADGRRAAKGIDTLLTGRGDEPPTVVVKRFHTFGYDHPFAAGDYEKIRRGRVPVREVRDRESGQQVEVGFTDGEAAREGARCLRCWINTVFDSNQMTGSQCIQCGGCVDVCPEACIDLVALTRVDPGASAAGRFMLPNGTVAEDGAALLKDEDRCIRCGICARRCPVGCVTMEGFYLEDERHLVELAEQSI